MELTREQVSRLKKEIDNNQRVITQYNLINQRKNKENLKFKNGHITIDELIENISRIEDEIKNIENETGFELLVLMELNDKLKIKYDKYLVI